MFLLEVSIFAGAEALILLAVYGISNLTVKRNNPATRLSRAAAGVVGASILWLGFMVVIATGFQGPPGLVSLPVVVVATPVVDRGLARLARRKR